MGDTLFRYGGIEVVTRPNGDVLSTLAWLSVGVMFIVMSVIFIDYAGSESLSNWQSVITLGQAAIFLGISAFFFIEANRSWPVVVQGVSDDG
jgi:hypothetical protein